MGEDGMREVEAERRRGGKGEGRGGEGRGGK